MTDQNGENGGNQIWFPDDQHGYSIALCECDGGAYLGARQMGTPCCCERCGRLTRDQWDFLVEHATASLRMQYEASQGALGDLLTEHRVLMEGVEALADSIHGDSGWEHNGGCEGEPDCFACIEADLRRLADYPICPPG